MPDTVKQAVTFLTSQLVKARGADAIEMASIGSEPAKKMVSEAGGFDDLALALDLLDEFKRVT
jgi:hypothetical protein